MIQGLAPNYRPVACCATCEFGIMVNKNIIAGLTEPMVKCDKYGYVMPGGKCDEWEDD